MTMKSDNTYHVMPSNESHALNGIECWCDPISDTILKYGEVVGFVVVHNSKDGREYIERGQVH